MFIALVIVTVVAVDGPSSFIMHFNEDKSLKISVK